MAEAVTPASEDESQYRIEATGGVPRAAHPDPEARRHVCRVQSSLATSAAAAGSPDGLYHEDTRYLSQLELRLNDDRPLLLSANPGEDNALLTVDLANPDTQDADGGVLHRELIYVNRRQFVWQGAYNELLLVRNFDRDPHTVTLSLRFAADFADVFEVRGQRRAKRGRRSAECLSPDAVVLRYRGLDEVERDTNLRFEPRRTGWTPRARISC